VTYSLYKIWLRYVGGIFTIQPHGEPNMNTPLEHLNGWKPTIMFTMQ